MERKIDKRTLLLLYKALDRLERYGFNKGIPVDKSILRCPFSIEDIQSMKKSLKRPEGINLELWNVLLNNVQMASEEIGEDRTVNVPFLLSKLKEYRESAQK